MALYLRKGYTKGPVRLNISKSGPGLSFGRKGARIAVNRRWIRLHLGRKGLYLRKDLTWNSLFDMALRSGSLESGIVEDSRVT